MSIISPAVIIMYEGYIVLFSVAFVYYIQTACEFAVCGLSLLERKDNYCGSQPCLHWVGGF